MVVFEQVLGLFNCILTTRKLLEILSLENPAIYSSTHSNLELEVGFAVYITLIITVMNKK